MQIHKKEEININYNLFLQNEIKNITHYFIASPFNMNFFTQIIDFCNYTIACYWTTTLFPLQK